MRKLLLGAALTTGLWACTSNPPGQSTCASGLVACSGTCVDIQTNAGNCGGCGVGCPSGQSCSGGFCCPTGSAPCGGACADLAHSNVNCGACGHACSAGQVCADGACGVTCPPVETLCAGGDAGAAYCASTQSDNLNCGACGVACGAGQACSNGQCAVTCAQGLLNCGGSCVDPLTNNLHCGAMTDCMGSNVGAQCTQGTVCAAGACLTSCQVGFINCNGTCVDPLSNNTYCGASAGCGLADAGSAGTACAAGSICSVGLCQLSCQAGTIDCSGTCINPSSNNTYCGASLGCGVDAGSSGTPCPPGALCTNGQCAVTCVVGQVLCSDGKCHDPGHDNQHCGATSGCGMADAGSPGTACDAGMVCSQGACGVTCVTTETLCADGQCHDLSVDNQDCGACSTAGHSTACAAGFRCTAGTCQLACQSGLINCGGTCIDPRTNDAFCGATGACGAADAGSAGTACAPGNRCSNGACVLSCQPGFINCGGACVNPATDNTHCGATGACGAADAGCLLYTSPSPRD